MGQTDRSITFGMSPCASSSCSNRSNGQNVADVIFLSSATMYKLPSSSSFIGETPARRQPGLCRRPSRIPMRLRGLQKPSELRTYRDAVGFGGPGQLPWAAESIASHRSPKVPWRTRGSHQSVIIIPYPFNGQYIMVLRGTRLDMTSIYKLSQF